MLIGAMTLALGGCTRLPPMRVGNPGASRAIDVLTFNIEGLGWPAPRGGAGQLRQIGEALAALTDRE